MRLLHCHCWLLIRSTILCELHQCGSLIYFKWCSEITFFNKYFAENKTCNFEYTENYSPTNPIIYHFIFSVCTLELPWADYNLLKKKATINPDFCRMSNIIVWQHTRFGEVYSQPITGGQRGSWALACLGVCCRKRKCALQLHDPSSQLKAMQPS